MKLELGSGPSGDNERRADGRLLKDPASGTSICFARNCTSHPGCVSGKQGGCPNRLAHVCEFCGNSGHTTMSCNQKPDGFVHPYSFTGKGGKEGKQGGKGRKGGKEGKQSGKGKSQGSDGVRQR